MRPIVIRLVVTMLGAVALVALAPACGGSEKEKAPEKHVPAWVEVVSAKVSGKEPVKLNLGTFVLGDSVRLAWDLSGPRKPPVKLTFRVINVAKGVTFGRTESPFSGAGVKRHDEQAVVLAPIWPGQCRVFFSQRFRPENGPGYDIQLTVSTLL